MDSYRVLERQLKAQQARQLEDGQEGAYPWAMGSLSDRRSSTYSDAADSHCVTEPFSVHTDIGDFLSVHGGGGSSVYGGGGNVPLSRRTSGWSLGSADTELDISGECRTGRWIFFLGITASDE